MKLLVLTFLAAAPSLLAQPSRFGLPACQDPSAEFADRGYFVLCHDSALRVPSWTAYEILPGRLGGNAPRPRRFRSDSALAGPVARDIDYRNSPYVRGHMVPAEDLAYSDAAIRATFVLSNAAPRLASVNSGSWRRVENAVRATASAADSVYAFTGPVFARPGVEYIGAVAVPAHFFKVWLAIEDSQKRMYAAIVPNAQSCVNSLNDFAVSVNEVEARTGLDFFSLLEDREEEGLESRIERLPASRSRPLRTQPCSPDYGFSGPRKKTETLFTNRGSGMHDQMGDSNEEKKADPRLARAVAGRRRRDHRARL